MLSCMPVGTSATLCILAYAVLCCDYHITVAVLASLLPRPLETLRLTSAWPVSQRATHVRLAWCSLDIRWQTRLLRIVIESLP